MPELFDVEAKTQKIYKLEEQSLLGNRAGTDNLIEEIYTLSSKPKQLEETLLHLEHPYDKTGKIDNTFERDACGNLLTMKFSKDGKSQFIDFTIDWSGVYKPPKCNK